MKSITKPKLETFDTAKSVVFCLLAATTICISTTIGAIIGLTIWILCR